MAALIPYTNLSVVTQPQIAQRDPIFSGKLSDQSIGSSTTLQNDSALSAAVAANATYEVDLLLLYQASGAASVSGIKFGFTAPAGATFPWLPYTKIDNDGTLQVQDVWVAASGIGQLIPSGGAGAGVTIGGHIYGVLVVAGTAGTLQFQWAQNTSNATATVVKAGSALILRQVA